MGPVSGPTQIPKKIIFSYGHRVCGNGISIPSAANRAAIRTLMASLTSSGILYAFAQTWITNFKARLPELLEKDPWHGSAAKYSVFLIASCTTSASTCLTRTTSLPYTTVIRDSIRTLGSGSEKFTTLVRGDLAIGEDYDLPVDRFDSRAPRPDAHDVPVVGVDLNTVADLERLVDRDDRAAEEVGDQVLGSEGKGEAGDTCTGEEGSNVDLEVDKDQHDPGKPDHVAHSKFKKIDDTVIGIPFGHFGQFPPVDTDDVMKEGGRDPRPKQDIDRIEHLVRENPSVLRRDDVEILKGDVDRDVRRYRPAPAYRSRRR